MGLRGYFLGVSFVKTELHFLFSSSYLCEDAQLGACRLGVGKHRDFLHLLARLAARREGNGNIAFFARLDFASRIVGHRTSTGRLATTDNQIGIARVTEMEAVGNTLVVGQPTKIVLIRIKLDVRHCHRIVVALRRVGILNDGGVNLIGRGGASRTGRQTEEQRY